MTTVNVFYWYILVLIIVPLTLKRPFHMKVSEKIKSCDVTLSLSRGPLLTMYWKDVIDTKFIWNYFDSWFIVCVNFQATITQHVLVSVSQMGWFAAFLSYIIVNKMSLYFWVLLIKKLSRLRGLWSIAMHFFTHLWQFIDKTINQENTLQMKT